MSDPNAVDEIAGEARKFSAAMLSAMRRYSQASGWLERRRARKGISRVLRTEQREQVQARADQLTWTSQAVDRYRAHSLAVAARTHDPRVDYDRRARDAQALAQHRADLAAQFITNNHLTRTEQGIALDGLDAATVFPEYETGNLFSHAHKVKGVEALRYRALVARETVGMQQRAAAERVSWESGLDAARRANREQAELARIEKAQPDQRRYRGQMTWTDSRGGTMTEARSFPTEQGATEWMCRSIDHSLWIEGATVQVQTYDRHHGATRYTERGRPEVVGEQLAAREAMLRERTLAGQVHRDPPQARMSGRETGRFASTVSYLPEGADRVVYAHARHGSEIESAVWTHDQVTTIRPAPDSTVLVTAYDTDGQGNAEPVFRAEGAQQFVTDEVTEWWDSTEQHRTAPERETEGVQQERRRDEAVRIGTAQRETPQSVSTVTRSESEQAQGIAGQTNELAEQRDALLAQTQQLTQIAEQLTAERDQLRGERDEAVRKLVARTPAHERYGSPERQAEQAKTAARESGRSALADYQPGSALADAVTRTNGHDRDGMER
ncbi:hypothetical protein [Nocardia sp. CC227C]|uniref:hypothetical protein n=1 Tax=Nocardia sp. CC227C TaxID=3044562 RepID=UPI00278C41CB|nr:hypothetical protein [Nocardia sp. CC227C]